MTAPRSHAKLDALEQALERTSGDPRRLDLVRRAQRFKRSWVELAEALHELRKSQAYLAWGYSDLMDYCTKELSLRPATVDKLLLSFSTLARHAPDVLERDGVARNIPSVEAIDYFSRALGDEQRPGPVRRLDAGDEMIEQLRSAVFDEGQNVRELRARFDPVLHPKPDAEKGAELVRKTRAAAQRLHELVPEVPGLTEARVGRVLAVLEALLSDLDAMLDARAAKTTRARKTSRSEA